MDGKGIMMVVDGVSALDAVVDLCSLTLCVVLTVMVLRSQKTIQEQRELLKLSVTLLEEALPLISEETKRKQAHTKALEKLTDPEAIQEEMERNADIIEARQANRLTMPREDAGRPARVFRPKFSGKRASWWNPPRS